MKAAVFYGAEKPLKIEDVEKPAAKAGEALIKIEACGVCHTDLHYLEGVPTFKKPPMILGHEASGIVEEVGEGVTNVKPGDRVLIPAVLACGKCEFCRSGRENICLNMLMVGNHIDGAYAEYIAVPAKDLIHLPETIPLDEAAVISDALSSPFHAIKNRAKVEAGEWIAIYGCGGLGLNSVQIASALGASVIAVDLIDKKLEYAQELGAQYTINAKKEDAPKAIRKITGGGAHVAVDAVGHPQVISQALASVRAGGRVIAMGYSAQNYTLNAGRIMFREITLMGSLGCRIVDFPNIVRMVETGKLKLLVSDKYKLEEINEVFEKLKRGEILSRAIVKP